MVILWIFDKALNTPLKHEFAKLRALHGFVPYVPSRLTHLRAFRAFAPYVPWFLRVLIMCLARLICYLRTLLTRDIKSLIKGNFKYIWRIYIMMYVFLSVLTSSLPLNSCFNLSLSIYILSIHIHIKEIYVKTFRSDLATPKKPLLWQITLYQLLFAVICSFLVTLFDFCCYLFVLGNFVRFICSFLVTLFDLFVRSW